MMTMLNSIRVNDKVFIHSIDTSNDSTYLKDRDGNVLYEVTRDAVMTDGSGVEYGTFHLGDSSHWFFSPEGGYHVKLKMKINSNDLIATELFIFTFMLKVLLSS
jgi:hypothetical protein